ncbi:MAG: F0F1 ATP synthase subunit A [Candidatus Doudnabacteria bacterium]|nr:F0F1 ATP synthase subunit A [Candidatus Doudnabacteria bacterium]
MSLQVTGALPEITAPILFKVGEIPVTNTILMSLVSWLVILGLCLAVRRFSITSPSKFQIAVESFVEAITSFVEQVAGNRYVAWRIMPIIVTLVIMILLSNILMTLLPFLPAFTFEGTPLLRSVTNDFNATLALAVSMVLLVQLYSIGEVNIINYISRFVQFKQIITGFRQGIANGLLAIINAFVGLLDIVSEFAKVISLSLRLFGNMFAGEVLSAIFMGILAIGLPIPIMGLSTLSGVVQAIVFGALVTSYFAGVIEVKQNS